METDKKNGSRRLNKENEWLKHLSSQESQNDPQDRDQSKKRFVSTKQRRIWLNG